MTRFLHKTLLPSSAVTDCLSCRFTSKKSNNLVVVKNNQLFIYEINGNDLTLLQRKILNGNIESILSIDKYILLTFEKEAKISVLSFDDRFFDIKTESLHYFEDNFIKDGKLTFSDITGKSLKVDSNRKFCVTLFYDTKLCVLGLHTQDDMIFTQSTTKSTEKFVEYQYILDFEKHSIKNVKDYAFLDSSESLLWVLHENVQTWSGRIDCTRNTCSISQIGFRDEGQYSVAHWKIDTISHYAYKIIPLRSSIGGGCILVGVNSIFYINRRRIQSGLSLNDFSKLEEAEMKIDLKKTEEILTFEVSDYDFLKDDTILFGLTSGRLYTLHLINNGHIVRDMELSKLMVTVPPSCLSILRNDLFFIGSMVGDSILAKFQRKKKKKKDDFNENDDNSSLKKLQIPNNEVKVSVPIIKIEEKEDAKMEDEVINLDDDEFLNLLEEDDDDDVHATIKTENNENKKSKSLKSSKEIEEIEGEVDSDEDEYSNFFNEGGESEEYSIELVTTIPSLSPLSKFIIFPVPKAKKFSDNYDDGLEIIACCGYGRNGHIARLSNSLRPICSKDIKLPFDCLKLWNIKLRIKQSNSTSKNHIIFSRDRKTTVLDGDKLEEVSEKSRLLTNEETLYIANVNNEESVLQMTKYKLLILKGSNYSFVHRFPEAVHFASIGEKYAAVLLKDSHVELIIVNDINKDSKIRDVTWKFNEKFGKVISLNIYENDKKLPMFQLYSKDNSKDNSRNMEDEVNGFLLVTYSTGILEIFLLPKMIQVYISLQFSFFNNYIMDDGRDYEKHSNIESIIGRKGEKIQNPYVSELFLSSFGKKEDPHLFVMLSDGYLEVYRTFYYNKERVSSEEGRLCNFRMRKVNHGFVMRKIKSPEIRIDRKITFSPKIEFHSKFVPYYNINGLQGIFVCGSRPFWIISSLGSFVIHPMLIDGPVYCFAEYNFQKLKEGFLYCSEGGNIVKFCHLNRSEFMNYKTDWPCLKIPLLATPTNVSFDSSERSLAVTTCKPVKVVIEDEEEEEFERIPALVEQKYKITLFDENFKIQDSVEDFKRYEHVNDCQILALIRQNDFVNLMVVATGFARGEDSHGMGRIILYDFRAGFGDLGEKKLKFDKLTQKDIKGAVSCIGSVEGWLVITIGVKIYIYYYDWKNNILVPGAFYDTQFYITKIISVKNYIIFCDCFRSINILRWVESGHKLYLLARDNNTSAMYRTNVLVDDRNLYIIGYDICGNCMVYNYSPLEFEDKLTKVADFRIGEVIQSTETIVTKSKSGSGHELDKSLHFNIYATKYGGIGFVMPIGEKDFNTLDLLQIKLYTNIPHDAGLHPKTYRLYTKERLSGYTYKKGIIDGDLVWKYQSTADRRKQNIIARMIGTSRNRIVQRQDLLGLKTIYF